jgi:heptosyltransferase-2
VAPSAGRRGTARAEHRILTSAAWCRPCMLRECPIDHRCMTGISVATVLEAVLR